MLEGKSSPEGMMSAPPSGGPRVPSTPIWGPWGPPQHPHLGGLGVCPSTPIYGALGAQNPHLGGLGVRPSLPGDAQSLLSGSSKGPRNPVLLNPTSCTKVQEGLSLNISDLEHQAQTSCLLKAPQICLSLNLLIKPTRNCGKQESKWHP